MIRGYFPITASVRPIKGAGDIVPSDTSLRRAEPCNVDCLCRDRSPLPLCPPPFQQPRDLQGQGPCSSLVLLRGNAPLDIGSKFANRRAGIFAANVKGICGFAALGKIKQSHDIQPDETFAL